VVASVPTTPADRALRGSSTWLALAGAASLAERLVAAYEPSIKGEPHHDLLRTETGGERPHGLTES
jgi:hypothetical protein